MYNHHNPINKRLELRIGNDGWFAIHECLFYLTCNFTAEYHRNYVLSSILNKLLLELLY